jgi:hypothetical protein
MLTAPSCVTLDDAKPWVHFLKSFRQDIFEKIFREKGLKKKDGTHDARSVVQKSEKHIRLSIMIKPDL